MQNVSAVRSGRIGEEIETIQMAIGFQGIANQDTDEMEIIQLLFTGYATSLLHDVDYRTVCSYHYAIFNVR